jgi:hypothetical protein
LPGKYEDIYTFRKNVDINLLRNLITLIDGYLINYFDDPLPFGQKLKSGALGPELSKEWKRIERSLMKIAVTMRKMPELKSIVRLCTTLKMLTLVFMVSGTTLAISASFWVGATYFYYLSTIFITFSAISTIWYKIFERKLSVKIKKYFEEHKTKYEFTRNYLKNQVQKLIFSMAHHLKVKMENPEKYPLSLYNEDYKGIKIIKKSGWLRGKHKVVVMADDEALIHKSSSVSQSR